MQPNARLSWLINDRQTLWFAASRAVRIPSRLDADLRLTVPLSIPEIPFPVYVNVNGSHEFESEELLAYEAGYRIQASDHLFVDLAAFYNDYDKLQTIEPEPPELVLPSYIILPNTLHNNMHGKSHGGTVMLNWQAAPNWRMRFHYAFLDLGLQSRPESLDGNAPNIAGNSPEHQFSVFSFFDFLEDFNLYTALRYVDDLPNLGVEDYTAVDLSVRWSASDDFTVSLTAQNLSESSHSEFSPVSMETERAVYLKFSWEL
jgi:iron complex outermembrane receptor protein